jgi:hypothetical protein
VRGREGTVGGECLKNEYFYLTPPPTVDMGWIYRLEYPGKSPKYPAYSEYPDEFPEYPAPPQTKQKLLD